LTFISQSVLEIEKHQSVSILCFLQSCLFSHGKYIKASSTPQRTARGPRRERPRTEKAERSLTARLQHYPTTGHPRGSRDFESTSTRLCSFCSFSPFTLPLLSRPASKPFSSPFSRSRSTKNPLAKVGGRMMLSVIVSCADTQGSHVTFHTSIRVGWTARKGGGQRPIRNLRDVLI